MQKQVNMLNVLEASNEDMWNFRKISLLICKQI